MGIVQWPIAVRMSRGYVDRKRRFSDVQESYTDTYAGPEEFVEAGTRGFLVSTLPDKEEFGVDDAIELLRQAAIKLTGGIKAGKKTNVDSGYVRIDFMDPKAVTLLPRPDGEEEEEEEEEEEKKEEGKEEGKEKKTEESDQKESGGTEDTAGGKQESGEEEEKEEGKEKEEESDDKDKKEELDDKEKKEDQEEEKETKEEDKKDSKKEKESESSEKKGTKEEKWSEKSKDGKDKGKEKKTERRYVFMKSSYKFKAFRTEIRNLMFVKSDFPDPCQLAVAAMEIVVARKLSSGDSVSQLMPALGVCEFDLFQLEVMCRRVLGPVFDESLPPKTVSVMLFDKLSEPGSLMLMEVVRNTIWSINPLTCTASPLTEPDLTLRLEVIGSKLIMCCMSQFIKYRQYSPNLLLSLGEGEAEDDDLTHISTEQRREYEERRERKRKQEEERKMREEAKRLKREQEAKERQERRAAEEAKREEERKKKAERKEKAEAEKTKEGEAETDTPKNDEKVKEETGEEGSEPMETDDRPKGRRRSRKSTCEEEETAEVKDSDTGGDAHAGQEEDGGKSARSKRSSSRISRK
ncbi:inner centromere protein isoform X2 [Aplysia californica]|uniref:Inner centromere protein isoform X2 n=1 Tax=Aplysia californica TaxID=6500 RepID=A0ABM0KAY8_APLCA|nr:inner centromere protein isoform X2 [Aplysia californica]